MDPEYASLEKAVNLPDLLARVEDDRELLNDLLEMFQTELPGHLEALQESITTGELSVTAKAAHAIKGMLANLSMEKGATLAATVEAAARNGDIQTVKSTFIVFEQETASLSAAVDAFMAGK
jgi:HPt (histidine-containing phosphotransfer) domain-containing protein